ncbi:MAG: hypothetical protein K940chlam9_00527 [Chlamydiae bacterium]|nr:hypothetical protein [Chlamydiota bacterium]
MDSITNIADSVFWLGHGFMLIMEGNSAMKGGNEMGFALTSVVPSLLFDC